MADLVAIIATVLNERHPPAIGPQLTQGVSCTYITRNGTTVNYLGAMSRPSVHYEQIPDGDDEEHLEDLEAAERRPLTSNGSTESLPTPTIRRSLFGGLFSKPLVVHNDRLPSVIQPPPTPMSSDGVFNNIPAKPSSSRDIKEDEELGEDEWIFMTLEQRKKLKPPKYSRIKRDRAPRYTTEYTPPQLPPTPNPPRKKRDIPLNPRVNSLPAGSSAAFLCTAILCTFLPFLGSLSVYIANMGRWRSHACRLGARTGMGLGLIHVGAMIIYIPALLPSISAASSTPLILFFIWTMLVGLPIGWRLSSHAVKEFIWVHTQERVLRGNLGLAAAAVSTAVEDDDDVENGYTYIEGTDIRVRDLRKILARARDARLARSLRAAGF